ncbi:MAG: hypothetical protein ABWJ97_03000 [Thermoproteus sp.]
MERTRKALEELPQKIDRLLGDIARVARALDDASSELQKASERLKMLK